MGIQKCTIIWGQNIAIICQLSLAKSRVTVRSLSLAHVCVCMEFLPFAAALAWPVFFLEYLKTDFPLSLSSFLQFIISFSIPRTFLPFPPSLSLLPPSSQFPQLSSSSTAAPLALSLSLSLSLSLRTNAISMHFTLDLLPPLPPFSSYFLHSKMSN